MINLLSENPAFFLVYIVALFIAITIHEFAHAFAADYLGDPTPRIQGRLTLNPKSHIDPLGLLFLFFFGFGWGRPVEYDPYNLKNPRKDSGIIALAGPLSNIIIALIFSLILRLIVFFDISFLKSTIYLLFVPIIQINIFLSLFNLIPVYPLDGFSIIGSILPKEKAEEWHSLKKYGWIFLILIIIPFGSSSMIDTFLRPAAMFFIKLLIP